MEKGTLLTIRISNKFLEELREYVGNYEDMSMSSFARLAMREWMLAHPPKTKEIE